MDRLHGSASLMVVSDLDFTMVVDFTNSFSTASQLQLGGHHPFINFIGKSSNGSCRLTMMIMVTSPFSASMLCGNPITAMILCWFSQLEDHPQVTNFWGMRNPCWPLMLPWCLWELRLLMVRLWFLMLAGYSFWITSGIEKLLLKKLPSFLSLFLRWVSLLQVQVCSSYNGFKKLWNLQNYNRIL